MPDPGKDPVRVLGARPGPESPSEGLGTLTRSQHHQSCGTLPCTPLGLSWEGGGNVPNMASVLRASREQRVQVQAVPEPRPPDGMTTSSTAPMPKALPRRPNLLALFPGISNDWRGAERYREAGRTRGEEGETKRQWQVGTAGAHHVGRENPRVGRAVGHSGAEERQEERAGGCKRTG